MNKGIILCLFLCFSPFALGKIHEIRSVNFFQKGELSKLVIDVTGLVNAQRKLIKKDKQILLDIENVKAGPRVLRGIDTSEFPGSLVYITGYKKPGTESDIRFALQLRDNVNSFLELSGHKIILNVENRFGVLSKKAKETGVKRVKKLLVEESRDSLGGRYHVPKSSNIVDILENLTLSGPKRYIGKRISINVNKMPLPELLRIIAENSGFNIIIDDEVMSRKPLTLKLTNLPWDQILDTILELSKLSASKHANILTVTTRAKAEEDLRIKLAAKKQLEDQVPLVTKIFPISHGKLEDIQKIVEGYLTKNRGNVKSDARTNYLIVNDTIEKIEKIKKIIEALDTETAQVLIEARIVEVNNRDQLNIGLTNGISASYKGMGRSSYRNKSGDFSFSSTGWADSSSGGSAAGIFGVAIKNIGRLVNLDFSLELAQQKSWLKIISSPKIVTQNKQKATLSSTEEVGLVTEVLTPGSDSSSAQPTTASADIRLEVTPQVTNEGSVNLDVTIEKGDFMRGIGERNRAPDKMTRKITTNVLVDNGSTVSIGGLYKSSRSRTENGIPILKDIPLIGWLFKSKYNPLVLKDELMVFITPRIINQEEAGLTRGNLSAIKSRDLE